MARVRERAPGVWEVTVSLGRDPATGRYRQRSETVRTGATRRHEGKRLPRAVEAVVHRLEAEADDSKGGGSHSSVRFLLDRYLTHQEARGRAPKTIHEYRRIADDLATVDLGTGRLFGQIPLDRLTALDVDELLLRLGEQRPPLEAGGTPRKGLADTTRHHYAALLSQALNQAVRWEWLDRNVADSSEKPSRRGLEREPPSPDQVLALVRACEKEHPDLASLIMVSALTGCRRGEICGLRWCDVDLDRAQLVVAGAITDLPDAKGGASRKNTKTHRARRLALDELTVAILGRQHDRAAGRCQLAGVELAGDAYIWSQDVDHSTFWRPGRVTDSFRTARRDAKLDGVRLQDLRHWAATHLLGSGVDVKTASSRLGNSPEVLSTRYAHRIPARDQAAADVLGALLAG